MTLSLIISYYKQFENLNIILESLKNQTDKKFEIIIAEDDNENKTKDIIRFFIQKFGLNIKHVFHEDKGFRKNMILNKAIHAANGEILVFIDGDCIPNKKMVFQYKKNISERIFLIGRRVWLSKKMTEKIRKSQKQFRINLLNLVLTKSTRIEESVYLPFKKTNYSKRGLCGCNWAALKSTLFEINGFDEDYHNAGVGEDVDIEWRLLKNGNIRKSIRNKAFVYHLYHKRMYSDENVQKNYKLFHAKKMTDIFFCENGLIKK